MIRKWRLMPYKGKWQHMFCEQLAMEELKKKVTEEHNPGADFVELLTSTFGNYGLRLSFSAYSFTIKNLMQRSLFPQLPFILDNLEKVESFETSERIFINLIHCYGDANMLQEAVDIFFRIPKFRCTPSVKSLDSLLFTLCKRKEGLILVPDVLTRIPLMNLRLEGSSFWILIRALCKNGKVLSALELLDMMKLQECIPDSRTYSYILSSLCENADSVKVLDFLEEMKNAGFSPSLMDCTSVINVLVKEGKADDAFAILWQMKSDGLCPDVVNYTSVLKGYILSGDFQKAEAMFDEMLVIGLVPDSFAYNTYINGLCKQGHFEQACTMLVFMEKMGCSPGTLTYNIIIGAYCKAGEFGKAKEIMKRMQEKNVAGNSHTYRFMSGLLNKGEIVE
uniref:Pentatricopeptide repeat-containing protein At2g38420, mitochondrial n=1 Tax=Anthurium amnicola TaxID=1678845 RepID=A0A1D1YD27_9ARAE